MLDSGPKKARHKKIDDMHIAVTTTRKKKDVDCAKESESEINATS